MKFNYYLIRAEELGDEGLVKYYLICDRQYFDNPASCVEAMKAAEERIQEINSYKSC